MNGFKPARALKVTPNWFSGFLFLRRRLRSAPVAIVLVVVVFLILRSAFADEPTSKPASGCRTARECLLRGDYERACALYEEMGRKRADAVSAACGRAEVDLQLGDYEAGITRLQAVAGDGARVPAWHTELAELLTQTGAYEQAMEHLRKALELDENCHAARWRLGFLLEMLGRTSAARDTYQVFEDVMTGGSLPDRAEDLVPLGRGFYRYSTLSRHPDLVQRTRHVLTEVFQEAFEFVDSLYWPARLAAAELLAEKHQSTEAKEDFEAVLKQNPRAADAMVGLGRLALEDWDFDEVQRQADGALKVNPHHVGARVLLARMRMTERKYGEAVHEANQALKTNPVSLEALAVLAAAQLRLGEDEASAGTQARIEKICPTPAQMHHEIGAWLSAGRQYAEAEKHFKKAMEFAPTWSEPATDLGQLYMETGEEESARSTLEGAFALDSFNRHTHNVLQLLDSVEKFARIESEHFIIKYNGSEDAVVAPYLAEALESIYPDVCGDFEFHPAKKTIIEMFPDHMGFSVRITGRPFIATVGACTGRVIAFTAPRGRPPFGRFNWASVLRHEFTHTVTLGATENRIPHWMTEGLAVHEEPVPRPWRVKQMLCTALRGGQLFDLQSIDWGFMRPRRANDRQLAYAQSEWMVEYISERWGFQSVKELLRAFRERKTQAAAFKDVLKVGPEEFTKDFLAWAAKQVAKWGLPTDALEEPSELTEKLDEKPDDAGLMARLAESLLQHGDLPNAEKWAKKALKADKNEALALATQCHCLIAKMLEEADEAERQDLVSQVNPLLRRLIQVRPDDPAATKYLGYVEQAWGQKSEAIEWFLKYQKRYPDDPDTFRRLAGIYLQQERIDPALGQLERLSQLSEDEAAVMSQIARIYDEKKSPALAARWYRKAIDVDPYAADLHGALADARLAAGEFAAAESEFRVVCRLLPNDGIGYDGLARVYKAMGQPEKAAESAARAAALGRQTEKHGPDRNPD